MDVGVQIHPQHGTAEATLAAWRTADELGFASIWTWDHASPLKLGARVGSHEAWTLLAAAAPMTSRSRIGVLVTCAPIRPPALIADMARTVSEISGGRLVLGLGAGWRQEDFETYEIALPAPHERSTALRRACERIVDRLTATGAGSVPILVGGGRSVLSTAARCAAWNYIGPPDTFGQLSHELDEACMRVGRKPADVRRTVLLSPANETRVTHYAAVGADELILGWPAPFDVPGLLRRRDDLMTTLDNRLATPRAGG